MRRSSKCIAASAILAALLEPNVAEAANYTFCMFYHVSSEDSGNGEDYYTSTSWWRARGAKVRVREVLWPFNVAWQGYANESNGCFSFSSNSSQFYVDLYAETQLGPSGNVTIQAVSTASQSTPGYWTISSSPGLEPGTHYFYGPASDVSNILAVSNFTYYWFDSHAGDRITSTRRSRIVNQACPGIPNNSCTPSAPNGSNPGTVYINPDLDHKKFHIAHEMGHQIYGLYRGDGSFGIEVGDAYCTANTGGSECTYSTGVSTNEHALQSKEWQSCALNEGFAHFVATDVFNIHTQSGGYFHYYKSGYPAGVDVENGPTGGDTQFMESQCTGTLAGYGAELDWLRAFWDYHTNSGTIPTHAQIMGQMFSAHTHAFFDEDTAYFRFWNAATSGGFGSRWQEMSEWNGIDHY